MSSNVLRHFVYMIKKLIKKFNHIHTHFDLDKLTHNSQTLQLVLLPAAQENSKEV